MISDSPLIGNKNVGLVQWFEMDAYNDVEQALADFRQLGIRAIRTNISINDWNKPGGRKWYKWMISALAADVKVLPCLVNTSSTSTDNNAEPAVTTNYTSFVEEVLGTLGIQFDHVELLDQPGEMYAEAVNNAAHQQLLEAASICRQRGKKVVFSLPANNQNWLQKADSAQLLQHVDVVGLKAYPGVFDTSWPGWDTAVARTNQLLQQHGSNASIWITESGYSTWKKDERKQLDAFLKTLEAPVECIYWNCLKDVAVANTNEEANLDERTRHFGMKNADGSPKLLYTIIGTGGLNKVANYKWMTQPISGEADQPYILITGGAGFVGINLAHRLLSKGRRVMIFDNLSRAGVETNLFWLRDKHAEGLSVMIADIRDKAAVESAVSKAEFVFHFAAQVAVTSSLVNPYHDFEVNALGTLNVVEAVRHSEHQPPIIFTSTNKVYGDLHDLGIVMNCTRYHPENLHFRQNGISEERPLDFHSPYGCTKGVADQYILDYARTFGLKTIVFRMSCIYGLHQFGTEDQGWVAHFLLQALKNKPIVLYGDGKQVRDILFIHDLVDAFEKAMAGIDELSGTAFNMGGGVGNSISLLELIDLIGEVAGKMPEVSMSDWRPSDQKYYVSDHNKFTTLTGWSPKIGTREGVRQLYNWLKENNPAIAANRKSKTHRVKEPTVA